MQILIKLAVSVLRTIYFFFKLFLRPRKKITFLSRQSDSVSVDFELLYNEIKKQGFDGEITVLCKKIGTSAFAKIGYAFHILIQMYHIATSEVTIIDGYSIAVCVLKHKKKQKFVQIWHALHIVKKFGYATLDKPWGRNGETARNMCMHKNYSYVVACSETSGRILAECFNIPYEKIVLSPLPRVDYILNYPEKRAEIEREYPNIFKKPILLYAPTFRGEKIKLSWIENVVDFKKFNVVVKLHPSDKFGFEAEVNPSIICDEKFSSFDWMKVCSKLVTDYSGMGFEAMLLKKPVYYYLYDYEDYTSKNGMSIDLFSEEIGEYVTENAEDLGGILKKDYNFSKMQSYVDKYLSFKTDNYTKVLADFILSLMHF